MSLIPGQVIHGRYRVIARLHQGGMGDVYEVMDTILHVRCALKEMVPYPGTLGTALPQLREQFHQEARLLAELRHPNLPRVTDHFEEDGNAYLVMDFVYGKRLDVVVSQKGRLSESEVLDWARQLMEALAHCHEQGVIHRDVKPQNVIITPQGQAVLVDFGLAKLVDPDNPRTRTVMQGLGTPEYAPPEQYDTRRGHTDPRTDVYSLGATLYHALVGEPPPMVAERIVDPESIAPVRERRGDVSEATSQVLVKAMALQPSRRFQSIADMHKALFSLPLLRERVESAAFSEIDTTPMAATSTSTVLLARLSGAGLRINRRVGAALAVVGFVSVALVFSLMTGRASVESVSTATATATLTVLATTTSTPTLTATPSSTPTPTASPTSRPPTRRPTRTPEEIEVFQLSVPASLTPTQAYVPLPTPTPTPVPTNTPRSEPARPSPTSPPPPTDIPAPPDTPVPVDTVEPPPPPTSTTRPTPGPETPVPAPPPAATEPPQTPQG